MQHQHLFICTYISVPYKYMIYIKLIKLMLLIRFRDLALGMIYFLRGWYINLLKCLFLLPWLDLLFGIVLISYSSHFFHLPFILGTCRDQMLLTPTVTNNNYHFSELLMYCRNLITKAKKIRVLFVLKILDSAQELFHRHCWYILLLHFLDTASY